jgi:hypothetical protein
MRAHIMKTIEAANGHGVSQNLYSTLLVFGEMLSGALDRIDELEKKAGGGGDFLANQDVLGTKDILKG